MEQAAQWRQALKSGGRREREAFVDWLLESRRHVRNYLLLTAFDRELNRMDFGRRETVDELLAQVRADAVVPLHEGSHASAFIRRKTVAGRWALAAGIAVAVLAGLWIGLDLTPGSLYTTATGEQQSLKLDDGSMVYLNAQSRLKVNYSGRQRHIDLLDGEALFVVARDEHRPFRVTAGTATIQALGTRFNVKRRSGSTTVSVLEGRVKVAGGGLLNAGEEAKVAHDGSIDKHAPADIERRIAWRQRVLEFRDDPLAEVVTELNRYNRTPRFRIEDAAVAARKYTGVFNADDPQSLAELLSQEDDLIVERTEREIVIRAR